MFESVRANVEGAIGPGRLTSPPSRGVELFAVGIDWAQLIVRDGRTTRSHLVTSLRPGSDQTVIVDGISAPVHVATLARPHGRLLARVATISDLHIGEIAFGVLPRVRSSRRQRDWASAHPVRNLRAALAEIDEWAPDLLVVKGDLVNSNLPEEYEFTIPILTAGGARPVAAITGNHDGGNHSKCDTTAEMTRHGLAPDHDVTVRLVGDGAHVVTVESVIQGEHGGRTADRLQAVDSALRSASSPSLVLLHHQLLTQSLQLYVPRGIPHEDANAFLDTVAAANPRSLVSSGHTHRHRRRQHRSIEVTEVGSTKDFPGTWAGYEIYEDGIVQTVRRIADPDVLAWGERVSRSALGMWGRWSPGTLADRCFTRLWSDA